MAGFKGARDAENSTTEKFELFTRGEGNYSETDIKGASTIPEQKRFLTKMGLKVELTQVRQL